MQNFRIALAALFFFILCSAFAADTSDDRVTLNFVNADIEAVVKSVGQITGRNFLLDPRVKGTVNIVSASPIPRELTYQILLSALRLQGFAAIEGAGVTKIVPEADAKQNYTTTTERGDTKVSGDRIVTQVYALQYESANQLVAVLRPLITPNNTIVAYPNTNTLVITDYADNLKRINKIIESIDQPSQGELSVIPLKYASALDLSQALLKLMPEASVQQAAPGVTPRFYIAADTRTNSLLVRAENPSYVQRVRSLVDSLDTAAAAPSSIHVVYLRNADATKIAETLRGLLAGEAKSSAASLTTASTNASGGAAAGATASNPANNPFTSTSTTATASTIQADAPTNSLIISAPNNVYNSLRAVIDQLDTRRAQVFIEALIAEVTTDKAAEFGVQFQTLSGLNSSGTQGVGGTNFSTSTAATGNNILGAATNLTTVGQGLSVGVIHGTVTIPGVGTVANLGLLIRALESDVDTNILSTPNLLTMDNEEAKIVVGQNVPFITGSYAQATSATSTGASVTPFQTVDRQDVGITLKIKPTITEGGKVKLKIYQEVSSVADSTNAAGIITNKRSLESTVLIQDGEIIVLGGLIQDSLSVNSGKVPVLGNIPVIGNLFRYDQREKTKTNLMVFLRPYVIKNDNDIVGNSLTQERYDYIRGEQGSVRAEKRSVLPTMEAPQLPPWNPLPKRNVIVPAPADPSTISPETKGPQPKKPASEPGKDPVQPYDVKQ
jgi:general secretion pathway protein D